jgi:hypothetical protein
LAGFEIPPEIRVKDWLGRLQKEPAGKGQREKGTEPKAQFALPYPNGIMH